MTRVVPVPPISPCRRFVVSTRLLAQRSTRPSCHAPLNGISQRLCDTSATVVGMEEASRAPDINNYFAAGRRFLFLLLCKYSVVWGAVTADAQTIMYWSGSFGTRGDAASSSRPLLAGKEQRATNERARASRGSCVWLFQEGSHAAGLIRSDVVSVLNIVAPTAAGNFLEYFPVCIGMALVGHGRDARSALELDAVALARAYFAWWRWHLGLGSSQHCARSAPKRLVRGSQGCARSICSAPFCL